MDISNYEILSFDLDQVQRHGKVTKEFLPD